ncbi:MAG: protein-disulfide reductase DsbD N-terminal domain-containing protein, partial [Xanthomonadales bacterium]|nr:protein-disulfide reductase DsbD N-terminal domain-containing protein [Xanthomonadales bacterium]
MDCKRLSRVGHRWIVALCLAVSAPLAWAAVDESDLLPVEQAFALSAEAPARDLAEVRFAIAPGYYLYRHRLGLAAVDNSMQLAPFSVPDGEPKHDEFFGDVETYRESLTLSQLLPELPASTQSLELEVRYQGCADIGICYPPQRTRVTLRLPPGGSLGTVAPADFADTSPRVSGLSLGVPGGGSLLAGNAQDALPEDEAFRFEAIATAPDQMLVRFT